MLGKKKGKKSRKIKAQAELDWLDFDDEDEYEAYESDEDYEDDEDYDPDEDYEDDEDYDDYEDDDDDFDDYDDEEYEEGFDYGDEDSIIYEVKCACGEVINFDEETLEKGSIVCPNCGENLEFSLDDEDELEF